MFHHRSFRSLVLCAGLAAGVGFAIAPVSEAAAGEKVACGNVKKAKVKALCERVAGDEGKIKDAMKKAQGDAKDAKKDHWSDGTRIKCTSCHENSKGGKLKADAEKYWAEFEPFLK